MKIAIVYDSSKGTTAKAAETMGKMMEKQGHQCQVQSVAQADPADVSEADLICVGSWVKGLFIILQHPTPESAAIRKIVSAFSSLNLHGSIVWSIRTSLHIKPYTLVHPPVIV